MLTSKATVFYCMCLSTKPWDGLPKLVGNKGIFLLYIVQCLADLMSFLYVDDVRANVATFYIEHTNILQSDYEL
jgi:hypothetical protein